MFKKSILIASLTFCALGIYSFAFADDATPPATGTAQGLTISPPINDLSLKPGGTDSEIIRVTNPTQNLVEVYPVAMNFNSKGEGGEPNFTAANDENSKFTLAKWISFTQPKLALMPNQVVEFKYDINVPAEAEPGGHYGVVFLSTNPPEKTPGASQVSIASMVGSLLLVKIPGDTQEVGTLNEFSSSAFYLKPPVNLTTRISNSGNIHFKPEGTIEIKDWKGGEVNKITFNEERGNVLPDSVRKFENKWLSSDLPFYKIPVGRFTADLNLKYGANDKTFASTVVFWIIPRYIIITFIALLLLIALVLIIILRKKRKNRNRYQNYPPHNPHQNENYRPRM